MTTRLNVFQFIFSQVIVMLMSDVSNKWVACGAAITTTLEVMDSVGRVLQSRNTCLTSESLIVILTNRVILNMKNLNTRPQPMLKDRRARTLAPTFPECDGVLSWEQALESSTT